MARPSDEQISKMTPMMRQYYELKDKCPGAILFFRMGDFYEMFGDDAELAAPALDIVLTARERGDKKKTPFCGVPHHSARSYWLKLLKLGYRVAIADQVEDASEAKGLVRRDIVKIFSPGCIEELEGLESDSPNYTMALYEIPSRDLWGVVVSDISTGELRFGNLHGFEEILRIVELFKPKELLTRRFILDKVKQRLSSYLAKEQLIFDVLSEQPLQDPSFGEEFLFQVFGENYFKSLDSKLVSSIGRAELVAGILLHFKSLQVELSTFRKISPLFDSDAIVLSDVVLRDLEIFETSRQRQVKGSLYYYINKCCSPMGSRLLRKQLARPYRCAKMVEKKHREVEEFALLGWDGLSQLRKLMNHSSDIERLSTRLLNKTVRPSELAKIRDTLRQASEIKEFLWSRLPYDSAKDKIDKLSAAHSVLETLEAALIEHPLNLGKGDEVFRGGFHRDLDAANSFSKDGNSRVEGYQSKLREQTQIGNLKIKSHKTFGLLIEVTKSNLARVPEDFIRRQTMVNCERFVTEELKELDENLAEATEKSLDLENSIYLDMIEELAEGVDSLREAANCLAQIDLMQCFAFLAVGGRFIKPKVQVEAGQELKLIAARHPVVEGVVGEHDFVPNDLHMDSLQKTLLITGPNMAGKSTIMRQTAICALLNQAGSFVPAKEAVLPIFDQIFTRVGASDDLSQGLSTFMVEMQESAHILHHATKNSLVILDEVGRGTSTEDGLAIAKAILKNLAKNLKSWTLFATHYHELVPFSDEISAIQVAQTEVMESGEGIRFTHRLVPGASGSSYGIEVAQLAGVPQNIIKSAKEYLELGEAKVSRKPFAAKKSVDQLPPLQYSESVEKKANQELPPHQMQVLSSIRDLRINHLTPIQALNKLEKLQNLLLENQQSLLFHDGQN